MVMNGKVKQIERSIMVLYAEIVQQRPEALHSAGGPEAFEERFKFMLQPLRCGLD